MYPYNVSRPTIYKWRERYDGHLGSLKDLSRRPHSHARQHTDDELALIQNYRRRNPNAGLVVLWVKLMRRGYTRSISGLYRVLRRTEQGRVKLANPKYVPKQYEQMQYPGQRVQIDVKYVPSSCLVGAAVEDAKETGGYYQYTFISIPSLTNSAVFVTWKHSRNTAPILLLNLSNIVFRSSPMQLSVFRQTTVRSSQIA